MRLARVEADLGPAWVELADGVAWLLEGDFERGFRNTGFCRTEASCKLLAPVVPGKIIALGTNYIAHGVEMGKAIPDEPKIFFKPPSAVIGPGDPIRIFSRAVRIDPECELAVVIGKRCSRVSQEEALSYVFGYTCLNDVSCRDFQKKDGVFARAKGFDSFCPVGPWIDTTIDPSDLPIRTVVDGEVRAQARTSEMVFDVPTTIAFISQIMTLLPGDVIAMGTPQGVAPIVPGNVVRVEIDGLGVLENPVIDRD
jgi:2-keto-4-pentenoate hydratase/2-oxohepta-3-ene-1,7-dioic acid hydratase in catechol pathway